MKIIDRREWFKKELADYENDVDYWKEYTELLKGELKIADEIIARYERDETSTQTLIDEVISDSQLINDLIKALYEKQREIRKRLRCADDCIQKEKEDKKRRIRKRD